MSVPSRPLFLAIALALLPGAAFASFHFMQIEQAIGGVDGDASRQAIQLRMRDGFQNQVQQARIRAWDATGSNPVVVIDFSAPVAGNAEGSRVLAATAAFSSGGQGPAPDGVMIAPIPANYLAAGRLTFEEDSGDIVWSLCWGGASYTGPTNGSSFNDDNGTYGPCFAGPLPSLGAQALRFQGAADALSTTNANDYALSADPAVFTNNSNASAPIVSRIFIDGFEDATFSPGPGPTILFDDGSHHDH